MRPDPNILVRMASSGVVFNDKREVLLILRNDMPMWEPPGGLVDPGETHEDAVIRESKEEIGCDVAIRRCLAIIYRRIDDLPMQGYRHFRCFELELLNDDIRIDEHIAYEWFPVDALPVNLAPLHRLAIEYASKEGPVEEYVTELLDRKAYAMTVDMSQAYKADFWNTHPKVLAKRSQGPMKYDPYAKK